MSSSGHSTAEMIMISTYKSNWWIYISSFLPLYGEPGEEVKACGRTAFIIHVTIGRFISSHASENNINLWLVIALIYSFS